MPSNRLKRARDAWGILDHLWQLLQLVMDEAAPALDEVGLTPKAFFMLASVEKHPFPAELARLMHLPPPTVTYMVKQMEAKGFLRRDQEPGDLRKFRLVLSAAGRKAILEGRKAIVEAFGTRLARLAPAEIDSLERIVERLSVTHADKKGELSAPVQTNEEDL